MIDIGEQNNRCDECAENEDHHFIRDQVGRKEDNFRSEKRSSPRKGSTDNVRGQTSTFSSGFSIRKRASTTTSSGSAGRGLAGTFSGDSSRPRASGQVRQRLLRHQLAPASRRPFQGRRGLKCNDSATRSRSALRGFFPRVVSAGLSE